MHTFSSRVCGWKPGSSDRLLLGALTIRWVTKPIFPDEQESRPKDQNSELLASYLTWSTKYKGSRRVGWNFLSQIFYIDKFYWSLCNFTGTVHPFAIVLLFFSWFQFVGLLLALSAWLCVTYILWIINVKTSKLFCLWFRRKGILSTKFWSVVYHLNDMPWEIVFSNKINWYEWMCYLLNCQIPNITLGFSFWS